LLLILSPLGKSPAVRGFCLENFFEILQLLSTSTRFINSLYGQELIVSRGAGLRGGAWNNQPHNVVCAIRNGNEPDDRNNNIGFRCAKTPGL